MSRRPMRAWARVGWLVTTIALAVALVVGSWLNFRVAKSAVVALNRGQADLLEVAVRGALMRPSDGVVDGDFMWELMVEHGEAGLRYVAIIENGAVVHSAGEPVLGLTMPQRQGGAGGPGGPGIADMMTPVQNRVRVIFPAPPPRRGSVSSDGAGRTQVRVQMERMRTFVVLEIQPVLASTLISRARRSLVLSALGATILTLAALLFWRTSEKYAQARISLEEQRRLTVLGEMSAVLAHEIRNPLASLKGNAQLLAERLPSDSREKGRADRVVSEATRLEALTSDLLDFARSGPGELRDTDPAELLRTSVADVAEDGFTLDDVGAPATWRLDVTRIRQTLVNILQNARQASPDGRAPVARVTLDNDNLVYEVRDFGPGLPEDAVDRIFDPFFTTRTNGTGLGLAVAKRVVELHGGRISARTHEEGGAVFRIELPRA